MSSSRAWRTVALATLLSSLAIGTAHAQEPTADQKAGARAAATQGNEAFAAKKFAEALDRFKRAEKLMHAPTHVLMIARSHAELGQLVAAKESYNALAREQLAADAPPAFKDAQADAKKELQALEPRIPTIEIKVSDPNAKELVVTMDGAPVPAELVGIARPVDPGKHVFRAESEDAESPEQSVDIAEGARTSVTLEMRPRPPGQKRKTPPQGTTEDGSAPALMIAGWVTLGVGVAGLGVGGAFTGLGFAKRSEADDAYEACGGESCVEGSAGAQEVNELDDDANLKQTVGLAAFIAGGALTATGVTLLIVSMTSTKKTSEAAVVPIVGPGFVGLRGAF